MSRLIPINSADKYPRTTEAQNLQTSHLNPLSSQDLLQTPSILTKCWACKQLLEGWHFRGWLRKATGPLSFWLRLWLWLVVCHWFLLLDHALVLVVLVVVVVVVVFVGKVVLGCKAEQTTKPESDAQWWVLYNRTYTISFYQLSSLKKIYIN